MGFFDFLKRKKEKTQTAQQETKPAEASEKVRDIQNIRERSEPQTPGITDYSSQTLGVLALLKKHDERMMEIIRSVKNDTEEIKPNVREVPNIRKILNSLDEKLRTRTSKAVEEIELNLRLQGILDFVNERELTSVKETSMVLSIPKSTVSESLKELSKLGLIKKTGHGKYSKVHEHSEHSEPPELNN